MAVLLKYVVDVLIIAFSLFIIVRAAKKGFVSTILDFFSVAVSSVCSAIITPKISEVVYDSIAKPLIRSKLHTIVNKDAFDGLKATEKVAKLFESVPNSALRITDKFVCKTGGLTRAISAMKPSSQEEFVNAFLNKVAYTVMILFIKIIVFIILVVLLSLVIRAISNFFSDVLKKLPFIGSANTFLGGVFGFLKASVFILIICTALYFFVAGSGSKDFITAVNSSGIYGFVTEINPLLQYFN